MQRQIACLIALIATAYLALPASVKACPTMAEHTELGTTPDAAALADCLELARFDIPTGRGAVQGSIYGSPETDLGMVGSIEEALTRSGRVLSGLGTLGVDPIVVYVSQNVSIDGGVPDPDTLATTIAPAPSGSGRPRECVMATFPSVGVAALQFTIAHEFFHCVQYREFASAGWWVEGSAEWFASLVYQGTAFSDGWVAEFDNVSSRTPVTQMDYAAVVLFWWLHQNYGSDQIIGLLSLANGGRSQADALAGIISDDEFLRFVTNYLEGGITQPGGRAAASTPTFDERRNIDDDEEIEIEASRFVAHRTSLRFACGAWTTEDFEIEGAYKALRMPDGEWEEMPEEFESESEARIEYLIAGAATGPDGFSLTFQARKTPCSVCQAPDVSEGPEACLIGEWRLASGGLGAKIGQMLEGTPNLSGVNYPDLDGLLILRRDGTFTLKANDEGSLNTRTRKGIFSAQISLSMEKEGTWSVNGDDLVQCYKPIKSINIDETVTAPDGRRERITEDRFLGPKLSYEERRQFNCAGGVLEITQDLPGAPAVNWVYQK